MKLNSNFGIVEIVDEKAYSFGSTDNTRQYKYAMHLSPEDRPTSIHGILLNDEPIAVFGASGGGTGVHENSAVILEKDLFLAVGDHVVCITLSPARFKWATQADSATCFGVYYESTHGTLLSHGELEIARLSFDGEILWSSGGADIFTEGFELLPAHIKVVDFNRKVYLFNYENGKENV